MTYGPPECPECGEELRELDNVELDGFGLVDGEEFESSVQGNCPHCGRLLDVYSTTPVAYEAQEPTRYRAEYGSKDGVSMTVEVTEREAREAYDEHAGQHGWESWEERYLDAAEFAAMLKITEMIKETEGSDVDIDVGACQGVWEVDQ